MLKKHDLALVNVQQRHEGLSFVDVQLLIENRPYFEALGIKYSPLDARSVLLEHTLTIFGTELTLNHCLGHLKSRR